MNVTSPVYSNSSNSPGSAKRGLSSPYSSDDAATERKKKRKSRWGNEDETEKVCIPGLPTQLPPNLDPKQEQIYMLQFQVEEISRKLRTGELGIPSNPENRSPSPEPIYNSEGKRMNTREFRTRKKLEEERHAAISKLIELNPEYKPPPDYKPPQIRITDKVFIPHEEYPEINFVGLLIGPRGNTLKALEKETGAKVIIRGKGSVKEGKIGRKDGLPMPGEDEPLHAYITAQDHETVDRAKKRITEIIKQGIEVPETENDLRKQQLRELALLNGTLRENDGLTKLRAIAEAQTIATNTIICTACGGAGHLASDCKMKRPSESLTDTSISGAQTGSGTEDRFKMDSEYSALMAELGVSGVSTPTINSFVSNSGYRPPASSDPMSNVPPPSYSTNNNRPQPYPNLPPPPGTVPPSESGNWTQPSVNGTSTPTTMASTVSVPPGSNGWGAGGPPPPPPNWGPIGPPPPPGYNQRPPMPYQSGPCPPPPPNPYWGGPPMPGPPGPPVWNGNCPQPPRPGAPYPGSNYSSSAPWQSNNANGDSWSSNGWPQPPLPPASRPPPPPPPPPGAS